MMGSKDGETPPQPRATRAGRRHRFDARGQPPMTGPSAREDTGEGETGRSQRGAAEMMEATTDEQAGRLGDRAPQWSSS